jgi:hypothetical protein
VREDERNSDMRDNRARSTIRFMGKLAVVWTVAAVATVAIRRAATPTGRRALARRAERTGRHLRFWCDWLASLRDELRSGRSERAVIDDIEVPAASSPPTAVPVGDRSATA